MQISTVFFVRLKISESAKCSFPERKQKEEEREHTLNELKKMEAVRNYLLDNGIIDADGIKEDTL